jgi:hypothetical protein
MIIAMTSLTVWPRPAQRADELAHQHHADPVGHVAQVVDVVADQQEPGYVAAYARHRALCPALAPTFHVLRSPSE